MPTTDQQVHVVAAVVGFTSYVLLWLAVVWGIVLRKGWAQSRTRHSSVYRVHMTTALFGLTLGVVHAAVQLAAPSGPVRLVDQFIPFLNPVDPLGIGVGVLGLELMLAAAVSVAIQRKLGHSRWRALHGLTYVAFMLLVAHILISGTDTAPPYVWGSVVATWLFVVLLWFTTTRGAARIQRRRATLTGRPRVQEVAVNVDPGRCVRFGFCEQEAPETFSLRSDGRLSYRAAVPPEQLNAAIRAVEVCPARAIMLSRMPTTVRTPRTSAAPISSVPTPRSPSPIELERDRYDRDRYERDPYDRDPYDRESYDPYDREREQFDRERGRYDVERGPRRLRGVPTSGPATYRRPRR